MTPDELKSYAYNFYNIGKMSVDGQAEKDIYQIEAKTTALHQAIIKDNLEARVEELNGMRIDSPTILADIVKRIAVLDHQIAKLKGEK